ncbi:MAG: transglycosylase domain-containing protein [Clostridia bacterium]|nr:transglycosylase domain-containing protein [Clostridia bacterium]
MNKENTSPAKNKRRKKKKKPLSRGLTAFLTAFLMVFMIGVLTAGIIVIDIFSDIGLINIGHNPEKDIAGVDYIDLDNYIANQSQTTIIYGYDADGNEIEIARLHGQENREWVDLEEVCQDLQDAVVALEDKRFPTHKGVDWIRTIGVVVKYSFSQGGSTLTQQLIKNLTGENAGTFVRKYKEIKNALALEQHFDKDEILEAYLNTIYLDMGCYGIKTGAEYYFNKDVSDLTLMESAILASITKAPRGFNPIVNYENNRARATECLNYMLEQGYITKEEFDAALAEEVIFYGDDREREEEYVDEEDVMITTEYNSYYVDLVIETLIDDLREQYGYTESEAFRKVYYGGLKVYAALDMDIQDEIEYVYENRITFPKEADTEENPAIQSSMVILDYEGRIVATAGRLGQKTGDRTLNIGTTSPRQPGSTIKPLSAYAPAIELNYYTWSSYIPNYGIAVRGEDKPWPTNYGGVAGSIDDLKNLPQAIAPSLNTIPARIIDALTPTTSYRFLRDRFKISTLVEGDADYAPLAIGAMNYGLTCLDMAAAYVTFGNGGLYYEPWCYYKVTNAAGDEVILEPNREGEQVISSGTADVMLQLLKCVVTYPNGTGGAYAVSGQENWAKSGTTSDNKDKWFCGGTGYYVGCAWTGFEKVQKAINTSYYGQNPAGKVYKEVMTRIHDGLEYKGFEMGDEVVRRSYCTGTGLLASANCPSSTGWYKVSFLPGVCKGCSGRPSTGEDIGDPGYDIPDF